jgi:hypothetical protein
MKKSILKLATLVTLSFSFVMCSSGAEGGEAGTEETAKTPKDKLEGKWEIKEATGELASLNVGTVYTFNGENFSTAAMGIETKGKIVAINDDSFSVLFENFTDNFDYKYHFDGEKLIIEAGSQGQVFTLEKQ